MTFDFSALLDTVAWKDTSLGCRSQWPRSLQTLLALLRRSNRPQYLVWGAERRFFYNAAFLPVMGIKHPSGFGMRMHDVWPEVWEDISGMVDSTIDDGASHFLEDIPFVLRRHGVDELTYFSFSYTPVEDDDGRTAGLMCVLDERTRQVQTTARLRSERERLHSMFKQAPGFMCITEGPSHVYKIVNQSYERLVGQEHEDLLGHAVVEVFPEMSQQGYGALLTQVYSTGKPFIGRSMPVQFARSAGKQETLYVDFVCQPMHDKQGDVCGIFTQGVDVTDRVHAEAKLRASELALRDADARKDHFLAVLGHELRNPLAPIHTAAQLLRRFVSPGTPAMHCVEVIERQTRQMSALVEDLVDVARITNGLITLRVADVDLNTVVHGAVEQLRCKAADRRHEVRLLLAPGTAIVRGDAVRLTQVVSNLLSNAIRYTPVGGELGISVYATGGETCVEVVDNGDGIAPELIPDLFIPFAQGARSADRANGGLGLGLPLVKALVDAHGGRIDILSEGVGRGSRFRVFLPPA
ncbi:MAG: ATP-binding protein [Luteimonas sp.]